MKSAFRKDDFPPKGAFSICEEMRRMKPDASAPLPFRAGFRPMRDAEKNPHNNQNPTMNLVSDNEQRNNRLRLRKP